MKLILQSNSKNILFLLTLFSFVILFLNSGNLNVSAVRVGKVGLESTSCELSENQRAFGVLTQDVACGCKRDQCRLSTFFNVNPNSYNEIKVFCEAQFSTNEMINDSERLILVEQCIQARIKSSSIEGKGSYMCINGGVDSNNSFMVGRDDTELEERIYSTLNMTSSIKEDVLNRYPEELKYYVDMYTNDPSRTIIPRYSYCKVQDGTAYWFYSGYFDTLNGNRPTASSQEQSPRCENVVFSSFDLFGKKVEGTNTYFGCLPNSFNGVIAFLVRLASGLAITITILIILINLLQIVTQSTNADAVSAAQKNMSSAVFTLIGILLTITILSFLGIQILSFGSESSLGGSFFNFLFGQ